MSNGWLYAGSITDIASEMSERKIRIIGYAPLMLPKVDFFGHILDIGIIAEHYDTEERFWCHASDEYRLAILAGDYDR